MTDLNLAVASPSSYCIPVNPSLDRARLRHEKEKEKESKEQVRLFDRLTKSAEKLLELGVSYKAAHRTLERHDRDCKVYEQHFRSTGVEDIELFRLSSKAAATLVSTYKNSRFKRQSALAAFRKAEQNYKDQKMQHASLQSQIDSINGGKLVQQEAPDDFQMPSLEL